MDNVCTNCKTEWEDKLSVLVCPCLDEDFGFSTNKKDNMQNKITKFKQLAEEFTDRKMYDIEFIEYHAQYVEANIKNGRFTEFTFEILCGGTCSYEVCDYSKTEPRIGEYLTLDQFKKLIEEL